MEKVHHTQNAIVMTTNGDHGDSAWSNDNRLGRKVKGHIIINPCSDATNLLLLGLP